MKREKQRAKTRQNIKDAFVELLKEKHIDQITVTELARKADVDRKTFYLYYPTVYDVVREIEDGIIAGLKELLENHATSDWRIFLTGLNGIMEKDLEYYMVIAKNKELSFLVDECMNILIDILRESLLKKKETVSVKDEVLICYAASGILGVYENWLKSEEKMPLEQLIEILGDTMNQTLTLG